MEAVNDTLAELKVDHLPMVIALNKSDQLVNEADALEELPTDAPAVLVSARRGEGIEDLLLTIEAAMIRLMEPLEILLPYERGDLLSLFYQRGQVDWEEHTDVGVRLRGRVPPRLVSFFENYVAV
jgi:GTP-binding protein HflX